MCVYDLSILYNKFSARFGDRKAPNRAGSILKQCTQRALRSKSLLGCAPQPLAARNCCSGMCREATFCCDFQDHDVTFAPRTTVTTPLFC